jgi:Ca2+-binding EF-hand superfamily protein
LLAIAVLLVSAAGSARADEVSEMFARMDADRDGQLTLEEFEKGVTRPYGAGTEGVVYQRLPARFRALDADASGYLEDGEYTQLQSHWQLEGSPPDFAGADRSGDARIDFREFVALHVPHEAVESESATP